MNYFPSKKCAKLRQNNTSSVQSIPTKRKNDHSRENICTLICIFDSTKGTKLSQGEGEIESPAKRRKCGQNGGVLWPSGAIIFISLTIPFAHVLPLYIVMYIVYILYSTFIVIVAFNYVSLLFTLSIFQNLNLKKHQALVKIDCTKSTKDLSG